MSDGPRYVASLQSETDLCCYKDFFEGSKFEEAKQQADEAATKHKRSSLVYDRKLMEITYKNVVERPDSSKVIIVHPPLKKEKKKREVKRKETVTEKKEEKPKKRNYFD